MVPKVKMAYEVDIPYLFLTVKTTGGPGADAGQQCRWSCRESLTRTDNSIITYILGTI